MTGLLRDKMELEHWRDTCDANTNMYGLTSPHDGKRHDIELFKICCTDCGLLAEHLIIQ